MMPRNMALPWPARYEPNEIFAHATAFALQAHDVRGRSIAASLDHDVQCKAAIEETCRVWHCQSARDEPHEDRIDDRFRFALPLGGSSRWVVARSHRHFLFTRIRLNHSEFKVAVEVLTSTSEDRIHIKSMHLMSSFDRLGTYRALFPGLRSRRIVEVKGTGRCGLLTPKAYGWQVLPLPEISVGASPFVPNRTNRFDEHGLVPLADFITYQRGEG